MLRAALLALLLAPVGCGGTGLDITNQRQNHDPLDGGTGGADLGPSTHDDGGGCNGGGVDLGPWTLDGGTPDDFGPWVLDGGWWPIDGGPLVDLGH